MKRPLIVFLLCLTAVFAVSYLGQLGAMRGMGGWYQELLKPTWNPPAWVFAPVWTVLYLLMGIALWLLVREVPSRPRTVALVWFCAQLFLNGLWSWIFFAWRSPQIAFWEILVLLVAIVGTLFASYRVNRLAVGLLYPYLLWVMFAATLNYTIWQLNLLK